MEDKEKVGKGQIPQEFLDMVAFKKVYYKGHFIQRWLHNCPFLMANIFPNGQFYSKLSWGMMQKWLS